MNETYLRTLVDLRERTVQKNRIAFNNRLGAVDRGDDIMAKPEYDVMKKWYDRFVDMEKELDEQIVDAVDGSEIVERLAELRGIGRLMAAQVVCMIDIREAQSVSALWRYAGFGVDADGNRDRPVKGQKLPYNKRLKVVCYKVATQFMMHSSPYRREYDSAKEYYQANRPDWTKMHVDRAAKRKMIKLWLSHLWEVWRKINGLPTRPPYAQDRLSHNTYKSPQEYGWSSIE